MEADYPYAKKNQRGARNDPLSHFVGLFSLVLYGRREVAPLDPGSGEDCLTGPVVEAGGGETLVHVGLTPRPGVARGTGTVEVGDTIRAASTMETGRVPALIPVNVTVVPGVTVYNSYHEYVMGFVARS